MNRRYDGPKMISQERKAYYPNGSLQLHSVWDFLTRRSEHTTYRTDGSIQNRTVRDNWDTAEYDADGSLQKVRAFSEEHRLTADEITIDKGKPDERVGASEEMTAPATGPKDEGLPMRKEHDVKLPMRTHLLLNYQWKPLRGASSRGSPLRFFETFFGKLSLVI